MKTKENIRFIISLILFASFLSTFFPSYKDVSNHTFLFILSIISIITATFFFISFFKKKRRLVGTDLSPLSLGLYFKRLNPRILIPYLVKSHDFYHDIKAAEKTIIKKSIENSIWGRFFYKH